MVDSSWWLGWIKRSVRIPSIIWLVHQECFFDTCLNHVIPLSIEMKLWIKRREKSWLGWLGLRTQWHFDMALVDTQGGSQAKLTKMVIVQSVYSYWGWYITLTRKYWGFLKGPPCSCCWKSQTSCGKNRAANGPPWCAQQSSGANNDKDVSSNDQALAVGFLSACDLSDGGSSGTSEILPNNVFTLLIAVCLPSKQFHPMVFRWVPQPFPQLFNPFVARLVDIPSHRNVRASDVTFNTLTTSLMSSEWLGASRGTKWYPKWSQNKTTLGNYYLAMVKRRRYQQPVANLLMFTLELRIYCN